MNKPGKRAPTRDPSATVVYATSEADITAATARALASPSVQASQTVYALNKGSEGAEAEALRKELEGQIKAVNGGDLKRVEAMLTAQAHTLDALFNFYARRAGASDSLNQFEVMLRLALRAQNQCRGTLETLAAIKNPQPVAFVKQANIAHGPQQVNNGTGEASRARKAENVANELSRLTHEEGQWLDFGTLAAAGAAHPRMATVGAIHRPKDSGG